MTRPDLPAVLAAAQARRAALTEVPEVFAGRGLTLDHLAQLGLGVDDTGNGVIPIHGGAGKLLGLKVRLRYPGKHKYAEWPPDNGNPPWFLPAPEALSGVLCIEGELNAAASWLALQAVQLDDWQVVGLGSTFGPVPWERLAAWAVPVVFFLDQGRAGDKSLAGWLSEGRSRGLHLSRAVPLQGRLDACEYAGAYGLNPLGERWRQVLRGAQKAEG